MSKLFGFADLWPVMQAMYPEVEDEREDDDDYEHPMTAVGLILLSAALLQTIEPSRLRKKGCRDIDSVQAPRFYDLGKDFGCLAGGSQIVFRAVGYTATSAYVA